LPDRVGKRGVDIVVAVIFLLVGLPKYGLIALVVKRLDLKIIARSGDGVMARTETRNTVIA
jgi:lipopolysaccharide/colanic/teichoic acid biosynthesis glycosyltransferase